MNEETSIQECANILRNCLSNNNEVNRQSSIILENMPFSCIPLLAKVYLEVNELNVKFQALQKIANFLKPKSFEHFQSICSDYNKNPDISKSIQCISLNAIQQENEALRNIASLLFSLIIGIEQGRMIDTLRHLVDFFNNPKPNPYILTNIINVFTEVSRLKYISNDLKKTFYECYHTVFIICQKMVLSYEDNENLQLPIQIRISASDFIQSILDYFIEIIPKDIQVIKTLLISLENSLKLRNQVLTGKIFQIMYNLITKFYPFPDELMFIVFNYIIESIKCDDDNIFYNFLIFWSKLADFEKETASNTPTICKKSFQKISPIFLMKLYLNSIPLNYTSNMTQLENSNILVSQTYDYIVETVQNFAKIVPFDVYQIFSQKIKEIMQNIQPNDFTNIFYVLVLFMSITVPQMYEKDFIEFLNLYWTSFILQMSTPNNPPVIRIASLLLIIRVLEFFPHIVTENSFFNNVDKNAYMPTKYQLKFLINLIDEEQIANIDPQIIYLYVVLIIRICGLWKDQAYESFLFTEDIFTNIQEKLKMVFNFGIKSSHYIIIRISSDAISHFITNSYHKHNTLELQKAWYSNTLDLMNHFLQNNEIQNQELLFCIQSELCSIISSFEQVIDDKDLSFRAYSMLHELMRSKNVFSDASLAVHHVICKNPDKINQDEVFYLLVNCMNAIHSLESKLVKSACILISTLCKKKFIFLKERLPDILNDLLFLFENKYTGYCSNRNDEKYVLTAIGTILESYAKYSQSLFDSRFDIRVFNVIQMLSLHQISYNDKNYECLNDFYTGVCNALKGYCAAYMLIIDKKNEKIFLENPENNPFGNVFYKREASQIKVLVNIASSILRMISYNDPVYDETILAFLEAASEIIQRCSRGNNLKLKNKNITKIFDLGKDRNKDIVDKINKCKKFLSI